MKTKEQIEAKLKEKEQELEQGKYTTYSRRKTISNWVFILKWVLDKHEDI